MNAAASMSSEGATTGGTIIIPTEYNPYVSPAPVPKSFAKKTIEAVKDVLGKWRNKAVDATKKGKNYAGEGLQHWLF
ncbi:GEM-like protein 1 [Rutidosis leptorrhynchoides]|uniref:GEM-like protein 1 n=1 Tax=Rutidosis leptorrhynchoides TaxID=125765 RepID=UPI003A98D0C8